MFKIFVFALTLVFFTGNVQAAACGRGIIIDLKEGGWNVDGVAIRLSGANSQGNIPSTLKVGTNGAQFVMFLASDLGQSRLDAIRRLASLAFAMGATVWTNSHNSNCSSATELSLLAQ